MRPESASLPSGDGGARELLAHACPWLVLPVVAATHPGVEGVTVTGRRAELVDRVCAAPMPPAAVVAIGAFDGVHVGHRALLLAAAGDATRRGLPCVAVTFDPDPADVLVGPVAASRLLAPAQRVVALLDAGADLVVTFPFTRELADLSYQDFFGGLLASVIDVVSLHVGADFRIGRSGAGTLDALVGYGGLQGMDVHGHPLVSLHGGPVTATRVRSLIASGEVEAASELLGHMTSVSGEVTHGRGEGASLGFPTANVRTGAMACMPAAGVYGGYLVISATPSAVAYAAAINVGTPPTFTSEEDRAFLEANLIGFEGDLYGRTVTVVFCRRLRPAQRFESLDALIAAVEGNIRWVRGRLGADAITL